MDPVLHTLLTARHWGAAIRTAIDLGLAQEGDIPSQHRAVYAVLERSGWALLVAPELWAAYQEWLACWRLEDDLARLRRHRDLVGRQMRKPKHWRVVEVDTGKVRAKPATDDADAEMYGEIKVGPDVLSVRAAAYAKLAAEITRAEAEYARGRARFVKSVQAYQRRLADVNGMEAPSKARAILARQAWLEGELSVFAACQESGAPPQDEAGIRTICANVDRRLVDRAPK